MGYAWESRIEAIKIAVRPPASRHDHNDLPSHDCKASDLQWPCLWLCPHTRQVPGSMAELPIAPNFIIGIPAARFNHHLGQDSLQIT